MTNANERVILCIDFIEWVWVKRPGFDVLVGPQEVSRLNVLHKAHCRFMRDKKSACDLQYVPALGHTFVYILHVMIMTVSAYVYTYIRAPTKVPIQKRITI